MTVPAATTAYIGWRTATESADKLTITLNGTTVLSATGGLKSSETSLTLNLAAGENTLTATYTKDGSVHSYGDMAYLVLPPIGEQPGNTSISRNRLLRLVLDDGVSRHGI